LLEDKELVVENKGVVERWCDVRVVTPSVNVMLKNGGVVEE